MNADLPTPDLAAVLRALAAHQVDYVLIGGQAARLYGSRMPTNDIVALDMPDNRACLSSNRAAVTDTRGPAAAQVRHGRLGRPRPDGHPVREHPPGERLEYDQVILVAHQAELSDELLYVGANRAVMSITVIGPSAIGERMRLANA